ncbi:hypothetical protein FACS1894159_09280 [Bacteroidia bacterium]|nr:hypothetical protein FACS1894159_09280 [Bacteroidia bacterium]
MKKIIALLLVLFAFAAPRAEAQKIALRSNALAWAACGTTNLGLEVALWPRLTLDVEGFCNPWEFDSHRQSKLWASQGELRLWFCRKFTGHFIGLHGGYADYDWGMCKYRYEGWSLGGGLSYGYALPIARRWRLEANLGAGYIHRSYDKSDRVQYPDDVVMYGRTVSDRFGLTRAGLNVVFLIH